MLICVLILDVLAILVFVYQKNHDGLKMNIELLIHGVKGVLLKLRKDKNIILLKW